MRRRAPSFVPALVAALASVAADGCGAADPTITAASTGAASAGAKGRVARYEMSFREDMTIDMVATFEPGVGTRFVIDDAMDARMESVEPRASSGPAASREWTWTRNELDIPGCAEGCTLRWRYDMPKAAERFDTGDMVEKRAGAYVGTPSIWLARPLGAAPEASYTVEVAIEEPLDFEWGMQRLDVNAGKRTYVGVYDDADESPYAAMGKVRRFTIGTPSQGFDVMVAGPDPDVGIEGLLGWARDALENVQVMFPAYPRVRPMLVIMVRRGDIIVDGTALGNGGASIRIEVGDETTKATFAQDWMLTHEMTHLTLPGLARRHHWAEEGMATYLEPIMRAKRGIVSIADVWKEWHESMHQGQPDDADDRLDGTRSWGRTYWGGALFWLQVDVALRRAAEDPMAIGLPAGFQSVFQQADISSKWSVEKLLAEMDRGTSARVVSRTWAEQAPVGVTVDLEALWRELGVRVEKGRVVFDEAAPLAAVRRAMVVGP